MYGQRFARCRFEITQDFRKLKRNTRNTGQGYYDEPVIGILQCSESYPVIIDSDLAGKVSRVAYYIKRGKQRFEACRDRFGQGGNFQSFTRAFIGGENPRTATVGDDADPVSR